MGDVVMLAFDGGSIKRSGPYDQVRGQLEAAGKTVVDFSGIMPNPTYAKAQEGATLAREHGVTDILAVGGGSVIDCCKVVAVQALLDEDIWQLEYAKGTFPTKGLALGAVVTTCPLVSLCQVLPAQRCSGLDAFGGNADSDFFGGFRTDGEADRHVHGVDVCLRDTRRKHLLARGGDLAARADKTHVGVRLAKHLFKHGEIRVVTRCHDENEIALVKRYGRGDAAEIAAQHFAGVREILRASKLRAAVEQRAGEPHARKRRHGGASHVAPAEDHGTHRHFKRKSKPSSIEARGRDARRMQGRRITNRSPAGCAVIIYGIRTVAQTGKSTSTSSFGRIGQHRAAISRKHLAIAVNQRRRSFEQLLAFGAAQQQSCRHALVQTANDGGS